MVGGFWAGLEEQASLNVTCCAGDPASPYRVQSSSTIHRVFVECCQFRWPASFPGTCPLSRRYIGDWKSGRAG